LSGYCIQAETSGKGDFRGDTEAAAETVPRQFWPVLIAAKADDKVLNNIEFNKVDS
jgi:hypothetical protein